MNSQERFTHRRNEEGSWDSICMNCFWTAAHGHSEAELLVAEACHICVEMKQMPFLCRRQLDN
jgi:hypothetical protein